MSCILSLLVFAALSELLAGRKALKKFREECHRTGKPIPRAEPILRKKYEFIPQLRHLLVLADKVDKCPEIMGSIALLRHTNADIMQRICKNAQVKTIDQHWDDASPEFIEFLTAYQKFVEEFRDMWENLPKVFSRADVEGLPEHLYRSPFTSRTWDFLTGTYTELKFYKCFCVEASNCSYREDFGYDCNNYNRCRLPANNRIYNREIRGEKEIPAPNKYWWDATEKVNRYPDELRIFHQKWVKAYWDKRNEASDIAFYERVNNSDSD